MRAHYWWQPETLRQTNYSGNGHLETKMTGLQGKLCVSTGHITAFMTRFFSLSLSLSLSASVSLWFVFCFFLLIVFLGVGEVATVEGGCLGTGREVGSECMM